MVFPASIADEKSGQILFFRESFYDASADSMAIYCKFTTKIYHENFQCTTAKPLHVRRDAGADLSKFVSGMRFGFILNISRETAMHSMVQA